MIQQIVATQIGVGMSSEFATFIRVKDKLKPMDYYLKDPENCDLPDEGTQPDLLWALITSLAEHYKAHPDAPTLTKIIKVLRRMNEEFSVFTLKLMVTVDKNLTQKIIKIPEASKLARQLIDFFE